jgi:hypothetical protein
MEKKEAQRRFEATLRGGLKLFLPKLQQISEIVP